jgi:choline dehydrogenase-like flavoprotein
LFWRGERDIFEISDLFAARIVILSETEAIPEAAGIVVVGSGPAGLVTALELRRHGLDVTILESGTDRFDPELQALADAELADAKRHAAMAIAERRGLGGTSLLWGGRCVAFDDLDFAVRRHVPESGWPFGHEEVRPWYEVALRYLGAGSAVFSRALPAPSMDEIEMTSLERWSRAPNLRRLHAKPLAEDGRLCVVLGATVVGIDIDAASGRISGLRVAGPSRDTRTLRPRAVVLACGGLETTRLLLAARSEAPRLFGSEEGPLGRYYMGHLSGKIADILIADGTVDAAMDFALDESGCYVRRRITLNAQAQDRHGLLNMAAFPDNPPLDDPAHRSAILSLAYLSLATPALGRLLVPEAIRMAYAPDGATRLPAHLRNIAAGMPGAVIGASRFLFGRYLAKPRLPGFFMRNSARRYALHYHAEQSPNPSSTVSLLALRDGVGLPRVKIDLRFREVDARSIVASHDIIDQNLRQAGIGRLMFRVPAEERVAAVLERAADGFHQIGTTRMASEPRRGVVDGDCRVHGTPNLFVASSSVFPTSGQANPTLLLTALAARLAAHLAAVFSRLPEAA